MDNPDFSNKQLPSPHAIRRDVDNSLVFADEKSDLGEEFQETQADANILRTFEPSQDIDDIYDQTEHDQTNADNTNIDNIDNTETYNVITPLDGTNTSIDTSQVHDTQIIAGQNDTQIIPKHHGVQTQLPIDELPTQVIRTQLPTQIIRPELPTQVLQTQLSQVIDTQLPPNFLTEIFPTSSLAADTQVISQPTPILDDTQRINPVNTQDQVDDTQVINQTKNIDDTQVINIHYDVITPTRSEHIQIPNTDRVLMTQVANTQEEYNDTFEYDMARPVYSSDQGDIKMKDDEVNSDTDLAFEDSIVTRKRKLSAFETSIASSPTVKKVSSDMSSDLEDVDLDENSEIVPDEDDNENIIVTRRRRNKFLVKSQSQSEPSSDKVDHPTQTLREDSDQLSQSSILHPSSVFASYKFQIYPGKVIDSVDAEVSTVKFVEGNFSIKNADLYLLDLRIGDTIRLRSSSVEYVVSGLSYDATADDITCIRGYNFVYIKRQKTSKSAGEIGVPLSQCSMELSDFIKHQHLHHLFYNGVDLCKETYGAFKAMLTDELVSPKKAIKTTLIPKTPKRLTGILFFITSIEGHEKDELKNLIEDNGGTLVEDEIRDVLSYHNGQLCGNELRNFSFAAVISNTFCRSAKYLQALALGWPILSSLFVWDAVDDVSKLQHWSMYLLPAGQSTYLGAVKSLDVFKFRYNYEMQKLSLNRQVQNNTDLLKDYTIVILYNRQSPATLETCEFIFRAFGVSKLHRLNTQNEINQYLFSNPSPKSLVYTNEWSAAKKMGKLCNKTSSFLQKLNISNNSITVGIINWEWVVQCVISQYIWSPELYVTIKENES